MNRKRKLYLARLALGLLPRTDLIAYFRQDTNGISFTVGEWDDFVNSTFSIDYTAELGAVDGLMGDGVMFTGEIPIARTWAAWFALAAVNVDYFWIGQRGVAIYSTDQTALASRIMSYLRATEPAGEAVEAYKESGADWLQEDGTQVYQEG